MKEMIYSPDYDHVEILEASEYKGIRYVIVNRGTHPCAYIAADKKCREFVDESCHGGVTYNGDGIPGIDGAGVFYWLGWDYGHLSDYMPAGNMEGRKRWTTAEIKEEVEQVIDKLFDYVMKEITDYLEKENIKGLYWNKWCK